MTAKEMGLETEMALLADSESRGRPDRFLQGVIESRLRDMEMARMTSPFLEPSPNQGLDEGDLDLCLTASGSPVRIGFVRGSANPVTHLLACGQTGSGKSCLQSSLVSSAAGRYRSLVIDPHGFYRRIPRVAEHHTFLRLRDLRLNLWDVPRGCSPSQVDQIVNHELCASYGLQFAEYEISEVVSALRASGTPNLTRVLEALASKKSQGFSKRPQYRDSALLVLGNLMTATDGLFSCERGMDLERLLDENVVLEVDGLPEHQTFVIRYLFEVLHLLSERPERVERPLLFVLDEGQVLAGQRNFATKMLQLRHYGVHLMANFQNAGAIPIEILGNCDALCCFRSVDRRDRQAFGQVANLSAEQLELVATLETGSFACFLPNSVWTRPFVGRVPEITFGSVDEGRLREKSEELLARLSWTPMGEDGSTSAKGDGLTADELRFLQAVVEHPGKASSEYAKFARMSGALALRIREGLIEKGYLRLHEVSIAPGRGRRAMILEPLQPAFAVFASAQRRG